MFSFMCETPTLLVLVISFMVEMTFHNVLHIMIVLINNNLKYIFVCYFYYVGLLKWIT